MKPKRTKPTPRQFFFVRVTRGEFLQLPIRVRRRALRDMAEKAKLNRYLDGLDVEADP